MKQVTPETAKQLQALGYLPEHRIQLDLLGEYYFAGSTDYPLPSWLEAAAWLEQERGVIIAREFPKRYNHGKWVSVRIMYRDGMNSTTLGRVPADIEESTKTAIEWLFNNDKI